MYSVGMTYQLKDPDLYPEYKKAHDELWPEMVEALRANEVNMVIYHYHGRLFLYATAPSKEHLDLSHEGPVAKRWLEYMATMMITDDEGKSVMEEMDEAFVFGAFNFNSQDK